MADADCSKLKEYYSCEQPPAPVFDDLDDVLIEEVVTDDVPHLSIELFGTVFDHKETLWPQVVRCPETLWIVKDAHHRKYQGCDIHYLLERFHILREIVFGNMHAGSQRCRMLGCIALLENLVVRSEDTFETGPGLAFRNSIQEFECESVGLNITTKCHYVIHGHLEDHIARTGFSLGLFRTHGAEHFHSLLDKFCNCHKVEDPASPLFTQYLRQYVGEVTTANT